MRILIIDTYYPTFLDSFYARHVGLGNRPYEEHHRALMDECFGTADFYSSNLIALGHEAAEVVANCERLQRKWAKENGLALEKWTLAKRGVVPWPRRIQSDDWLYPVLAAQVKNYRPDILHIQDMNGTSASFLREARLFVKLITGQIACPINSNADFREYDLVLSSFPHFVERFRKEGLHSEYFNLGFEPRVLRKIENGQQHRAVFVGGLSSEHDERVRLLEEIAESCPIDIWGYGINSLSKDSVLRQFHHGELWALDMYQVLFDSAIAINHHINVAESFANNMRLYEATGVGTMLITDAKENLSSLFEPGREVAAYHSAGEAIELINHYLENEAERKKIAQAGQARTLREHTYRNRMEEFVAIASRYLI